MAVTFFTNILCKKGIYKTIKYFIDCNNWIYYSFYYWSHKNPLERIQDSNSFSTKQKAQITKLRTKQLTNIKHFYSALQEKHIHFKFYTKLLTIHTLIVTIIYEIYSYFFLSIFLLFFVILILQCKRGLCF